MPDYSQLPALLPDVPVCILPETASTNADARALLLRGGARFFCPEPRLRLYQAPYIYCFV